jgi:hypothetical protein
MRIAAPLTDMLMIVPATGDVPGSPIEIWWPTS